MVTASPAGALLGAAGTRGAAGAEISGAATGTRDSTGSENLNDEVPGMEGKASGVDGIEATCAVGTAGAASVVSWTGAEAGVEAVALVLGEALRVAGTSGRGSVRSQPPSVARKGESQLTL